MCIYARSIPTTVVPIWRHLTLKFLLNVMETKTESDCFEIKRRTCFSRFNRSNFASRFGPVSQTVGSRKTYSCLSFRRAADSSANKPSKRNNCRKPNQESNPNKNEEASVHSNMSGGGGVQWYQGLYLWDDVVPNECAPSPSILRLSVDLNWEEARDPLHTDMGSMSDTCGVGPGMSFANRLLKDIGSTSPNIGLVPCAVGGTAIKEWKKGSMLYNQMVQRAKAATEIGDGGEIKAVLWYQGESDTDSDHASEVYGENLKTFIEDVRSDLGLPYLPFIQVALASGFRNIEKVRNAQLGLKLPNLVCVDAMGLPLNSDDLHLTTQAQVKLGNMLAEAYITQFLVQSSTNNEPKSS